MVTWTYHIISAIRLSCYMYQQEAVTEGSHFLPHSFQRGSLSSTTSLLPVITLQQDTRSYVLPLSIPDALLVVWIERGTFVSQSHPPVPALAAVNGNWATMDTMPQADGSPGAQSIQMIPISNTSVATVYIFLATSTQPERGTGSKWTAIHPVSHVLSFVTVYNCLFWKRDLLLVSSSLQYSLYWQNWSYTALKLTQLGQII
jgi:hypothetical protein